MITTISKSAHLPDVNSNGAEIIIQVELVVRVVLGIVDLQIVYFLGKRYDFLYEKVGLDFSRWLYPRNGVDLAFFDLYTSGWIHLPL